MLGKFLESVRVEMEFQIETGLRSFQAAGKLEQRQSIGITTKSKIPPGI